MTRTVKKNYMLRKYLTRDQPSLGGFSEEGMLQLNLNEWKELTRQMEERNWFKGPQTGRTMTPSRI